MLDTREIAGELRTLESIALIPRVASTNLVGRRIMNECIDNELSLPQAMIIAGEQFAGRGRNQRSWSSPAGKGIYATTLLTRPSSELAIVPLEVAVILADFLRQHYAVDARVKWPNDIMAGGRKIAGVLVEARSQDERSYLLIGTGINVEPVQGDDRPNATSIRETAAKQLDGIDDTTGRFIRFMDAELTRKRSRESILSRWRELAFHAPGDAVTCALPDRTIAGTWEGIDDEGRARVRAGAELVRVSAGEFIV